MTIRFCTGLLVFLIAGTAYGEKYGLGVQVDTDSAIYLPVNLTDTLRIEPYFDIYERDENETDSTRGAEFFRLGAGIFGVRKAGSNAAIYYGVRLAYVRQEYYSSSTSFINNEELDGYQIEPAFGFEYFFTDTVSLGGEAGYFFQKLDGTLTDSTGSYDSEMEITGTNTSVILRYYFQ